MAFFGVFIDMKSSEYEKKLINLIRNKVNHRDQILISLYGWHDGMSENLKTSLNGKLNKLVLNMRKKGSGIQSVNKRFMLL